MNKGFLKDIVDLAIDMQREGEFVSFEDMRIFKRCNINYEDVKEDIMSILTSEKTETLDLISKGKEKGKENSVLFFENKLESINKLIVSIEA